jgi:hypothetical protein
MLVTGGGVPHFTNELFNDVLEEEHTSGRAIGGNDLGHVGTGLAQGGKSVL